MKNDASQVIFCIAGMHRTGSSMFAHWLTKCGVFMGNDLLGSASSNKKGHFEDLSFLQLHIQELKENQIDGSGLFGSFENVQISQNFTIEAKRIIKERSNYPAWGWKEPRTTIFLPHWKVIIPELKVIILQREDHMVVTSLYNRLKKNKWYHTRNPIKKLIWYVDIDLRPKKWHKVFQKTCQTYRDIANSFKNQYPNDCMVIGIEEFISNHEFHVAKINAFLGTKLPNDQLHSVYSDSLMR